MKYVGGKYENWATSGANIYGIQWKAGEFCPTVEDFSTIKQRRVLI